MTGDPAKRDEGAPPPGDRRLIVIGGPTASGKSALALAVAERWRGTLINADSMQVYASLRCLTARPGAADEARVPHRLYGHLAADAAWSVDHWRRQAVTAVEEARQAGRVPIVVGGTGLYIRSLLDGLAAIPEIPPQVRAATRALFARLGNAAFHEALAARDPQMAARLAPGDSQRLMRAYEVHAATGRSLAAWQNAATLPGIAGDALKLLMMPERAWLYRRIDARFEAMLAAGALAEVAALEAAGLAPDLPVMKALGVPALRAVLAGDMTDGEAVAIGQRETRRYAKRQMTWFRHQFDADAVIDPAAGEAPAVAVIERYLLTGQGPATRPTAAARCGVSH